MSAGTGQLLSEGFPVSALHGLRMAVQSTQRPLHDGMCTRQVSPALLARPHLAWDVWGLVDHRGRAVVGAPALKLVATVTVSDIQRWVSRKLLLLDMFPLLLSLYVIQSKEKASTKCATR